MSSVFSAVITGIVTFAATKVDDLFTLMLFFTQTDAAFRRRHIVAGQYLGFAVLVAISLLGFFGGLSGIQGALRSAFLIKSGLGKEPFIGSSTVSAVMVDIARLLIYGLSFYTTIFAKIAPGMGG